MQWLLQTGKSLRSAKSYSGAISGVMSEWARKEGLVEQSLLDINSAKKFSVVAEQIRQLKIYQARNTKGKDMYGCAMNAYLEFLTDNNSEQLQQDIFDLLNDSSITETERATFVNTRLGQGSFRRKVIDQWSTCALTGFSDTRFLVASHIKPWSKSNNQERLDPYNGLLLMPNLDKVFDLHYISFNSDGEILISQNVEVIEALGVRPDMSISLDERHQAYMFHHRQAFELKAQAF
jgi:predicted restriction endonuclease